MKEIEKTNEEIEEIEKNKLDEKQRVSEKRKFKLKKEHFALVFAVLLLVIFIAILVYMLFFNKKKEIIVPDAPTYKQIDVGVIDFKDSNATATDLNNKKINNSNVTYKIVSDYYEKGILLSNTQVEYLNKTFIITSGPFSDDSFISSVGLDGTLKWITKLDKKEYDNFHIYKTIYYDDNYYVVGITEDNNKKNIMIIKFNTKGKKVATRIISENVDERIKDVLLINRKIIIITEGANSVKVYFTNDKLEKNKNIINSNSYLKDIIPFNYEASGGIDKMIKIACVSGDTHYIMSINSENYETTANEFTEVNSLQTESNKYVSQYLNGFVVNADNIIYKFDSDNHLVNKFDYNSIKLEDEKKYLENYKGVENIDIEDMKNSIHIKKINTNTDTITVNTSTMFSNVYDMYDSNLKINKRIILDTSRYYYNEGTLLKSFNIDDVIYEVYSYGQETPSIMISKIG